LTLIDAREVPAGQIITCEVCIVGGGAAALTVASELAGADFRVCVLESGGTAEHEGYKDLSSGAVIGNHSLNLQLARWRQFGGAANRWLIELGNGARGVRYTPLDEIDFEQRDWLPFSGWPFRKSDLEPFYRRAQQICRIGPYSYEPEDWEDAQTLRLPLPSDQIVTKMFQFGVKTVFTRDIPDQLRQAKNVAVYLHANVTEIATDETAAIATRVKVSCLEGSRFDVAAKYFVLATGGTENARLLLLSDRVQAGGLGNGYDVVGRFFNVHPQFHHDRFTPARHDLFSRARLYDLRRVNQVWVMGRLGLARAVMEREHLRNLGVMLLPREEDYWSKTEKEFISKRKEPASKTFAPFHRLARVVRSRSQALTRVRAYLPKLKPGQPALPESSFKLTLERGGWS
jgi:choline dehydrogenase-like flavoprotein